MSQERLVNHLQPLEKFRNFKLSVSVKKKLALKSDLRRPRRQSIKLQ
jgi:hypothetical protein